MFEVILFFVLVGAAFFIFRTLWRSFKESSSPEGKARAQAQVLEELKGHIDLKEWIKITYDKGQQPFTTREVLPLKLINNDKTLIATNDIDDKDGAHFQIQHLSIMSMDAEVDFKGPKVNKKKGANTEDYDDE